MHDTGAKTRKAVLNGEPREDVAAGISARLQGAGISRAQAEPMTAHLELLYLGAVRWSDLALTGAASTSGEPASTVFGEMCFAAEHLRTVLEDLLPFLDRTEDMLSEREDITHRESRYEREVAPFSRLDSSQDVRDFLTGHGFTPALAGDGAQAAGDLLKVVYLENRLQEAAPKPGDLYAIVVELILDGRRHLAPLFDGESEFMVMLRHQAEKSS